MSFVQLNLNPNINKALSACGYTTPTPIQAQSIPDILNGKDLVASAQTGTGKTAAFVLPALHRLSTQTPSKKPRVLILTPTRELATQIMKAASLYGKFLRFNIVSLVGGMPYHHQIKDLARGADIIVATPGRLMDHMEQKRVDLSEIEMLVLDEADRMLDMGFVEDVEYIAKLTPADRQTLLFSATVDKKLATIVRHLLKNPVRIDLSSEKLAAPKIRQEIYKVNNQQYKMRLLNHILNDNSIYKAIIFTATKVSADRLAAQLRDRGFSAAALHGDLKQNVRNRTLEQLRKGGIQFLVATDVAARGIDVSDITHVINFDLPRFCEDYIHRIGRTGRAGKDGVAISFLLPTDARHLQRIERFINQRLKIMPPVQLEGGEVYQEDSSYNERRETSHRPRRDESDFSHRKSRRDSQRDDAAPKFKRKRDENESTKREFRSKTDEGSRKRYAGDKDERNEGSRKRYAGDKDQRSDGSRKRYAGDKDERNEGSRKRYANDKDQRSEGSRKRYAGDKPQRDEGARKRYVDDKDQRDEGAKKRYAGDKDQRQEFKPRKKRDNDASSGHGKSDGKPFKRRTPKKRIIVNSDK